MKEEWKVFIRGVEGRGKEVIKMLEDLGAKNSFDYEGNKLEALYYIWHDGSIHVESTDNEYGQIIMENYHELHLPEQWKDGDILVNKNADYRFCVFDDYLSKIGSGNDFFFFHCVVTRHKGESYLISTNRGHFHDVNDYRLATSQEVEQFHEAIHEHCKDWDAENKCLVDWRWKPKEGDSYYCIDVDGDITDCTWDEDGFDADCYNFGNCFQSREEAEAMAEKIKKLLKGEQL